MYLPNHINLIVKLTEECNYSCVFCRYANHRQMDKGIPVDLVKSIIRQCVEYNQKSGIQNMNIIFHGGEPLLYGIKRLKEIIEYEKLFKEKGFIIANSFQTNSSLLSSDWCDFFAENNFSVGISLDGPIGMNDHLSNSATDAQEKALKAYHDLKKRNVNCGFLSVITQKHLDEPEKFFDFFIDNDISSLGLCYCYNMVDDKNVDPVKLGEFLKILYDLYFIAPKRINIREFDMVIRTILNQSRNGCSMSCRQSCGTFLTIAPDGNIEFCDDYDLNREGTLGNIKTHSITEILKTDKYQAKRSEAIRIVSEKCEKCDVFSLCKSGCMRNDNEDVNYFCDTFKIIYPYIKQNVDKHLELLERDGK